MTAAMPLVDKVAKYDLPRAVRPTYIRRYFARKDFCRATQTAPTDKYFGVIPPERCPGKTKFYTFAAYLRHALPDAVVSARFYDVVLRRNHLVRTLGHTHAISFAENTSFPISWNENGSYEGIRGYLYRRYPYDCCSLPLCERLP